MNATIHVIGIDAGGTKTVCQLADAGGQVLAEARGGGANLQALGELEVEKVLYQVMQEALGERAIVRRRSAWASPASIVPMTRRRCAASCAGSATRRACWSSTTRWSRSRPARPAIPAW